MVVNVQELKNKYPLIKDMEQAKAVIWMNGSGPAAHPASGRSGIIERTNLIWW